MKAEKKNILILQHVSQKSGETYVIRGVVRGDRLTILNTDKYNPDDIDAYLSHFVKDEAKISLIKEYVYQLKKIRVFL